MIKKLILTGLVIGSLAGCKKNDGDGAPDPQAKGCLIMSETINDKPYRTYEYDADQNLFRIVQYETSASNRVEKRFSFDYDPDDRITAFRETNLLTPFRNYQYQLHYSTAGQLDTIRKSEVFNSGPKLMETYALEYDAQQRLTKYKWADNYWRYEYDEAKNVTKWLARYPAIAPVEGLARRFRIITTVSTTRMPSHGPPSWSIWWVGEGRVRRIPVVSSFMKPASRPRKRGRDLPIQRERLPYGSQRIHFFGEWWCLYAGI